MKSQFSPNRLTAPSIQSAFSFSSVSSLGSSDEPAAYQAKKHTLMLEQQRIAELRAESEKNAINPGMVRRFLELATNLALLYQSAAKVQKRRIVEWATLNRLASGKSPYFEPSKWLLDTQNILGVLCCAADRDNSRTDVHKLAELIVSANGIAQLDRSLGYTLAHVPSPATTLKKNIIQ